MEVYVGLDVSLKETSICVVDGSGKIVCEGTVLSEPLALAEFLRAKAGRAKRIGLETGPTTTWLWHELTALGLPVICIDARHAKAALGAEETSCVGGSRIQFSGPLCSRSRVNSMMTSAIRAHVLAPITSPTARYSSIRARARRRAWGPNW